MSVNLDTKRDIDRIDEAYLQLAAIISAIAEIAKEALKADGENSISYMDSFRQKRLTYHAHSEEFFSTIAAALEKRGLR